MTYSNILLNNEDDASNFCCLRVFLVEIPSLCNTFTKPMFISDLCYLLPLALL